MNKYHLGISEDLKWSKALEFFERGAKAYQNAYGKPAVIIYDNVSTFAPKNSEILDSIQDDAKESADKSLYIAVFVSGEWTVSTRMQGMKFFLVQIEY